MNIHQRKPHKTLDVISQYNFERNNWSISVGDGTRKVGEPIIVPKKNFNLPDSASESKVWAISQFVDLNRKKGGFAVVDGENFEQGPVAKCYFDRPVPPTFHGTWIEDVW